jgi:hypothetical protein
VNYQKLRRVAEKANSLRKLAEALNEAAEHIEKYIALNVVNVKLEVDAWICDHCHYVHARQLAGVFNVAQPVDGKLFCAACDKWTTVENALGNLEVLRQYNSTARRRASEEDHG